MFESKIPDEILTEYLQAIQEAALKPVWMRGVELSRESQSIFQDHQTAEEIQFRIKIPTQPVSPKVTLWPHEGDWFCDCRDKNDPCHHVVAAVVALKNKNFQTSQAQHGCYLSYCLFRENRELRFERLIINGEKKIPLKISLVHYIGGVQSGRIEGPRVSVTKHDYAVDEILDQKKFGVLDRETLMRLLQALADCSNVTLDGKPIKISPRRIRVKAQLIDADAGFRLLPYKEPGVTEIFLNGAALFGDELKALQFPKLIAPEEKKILTKEGFFFSIADAARLVSQVIPLLEEKIPIVINTENLPHVCESPPRIVIHMEAVETQHSTGVLGSSDEEIIDKATGEFTYELVVTPQLLYGNPSMARLRGNRLEPVQGQKVPVRDQKAERKLIQKLQHELHLQLDRQVTLKGEDAVRFTLQLNDWEKSGDGFQKFYPMGELQARFDFKKDDLDLLFEIDAPGFMKRPRKAKGNVRRAYHAWRKGKDYIPLLGGGWAQIPKGWFEKYGDRVEQLLLAKEATPDKKLPQFFTPEVVNLCEELGQEVPDSLNQIKKMLHQFEGISEAKLPKGLKGDLRSYQKKGVNWLYFLRKNEMGAMLADDMGLGKTLQAMCAIEGRTLVVSPTSVLYNWAGQLEQFRPDLTFSIYYGSSRKLDKKAKVILTTYAIMRMDLEKIQKEKWETIILDEAQVIKNPESQVAQAAHSLRAKFRITLSGTPVENHLDDLWSQFQFLNPGLLGTRDQFQESYVKPISRGEDSAAVLLRNKVLPFVLRRLKKEVAPELPPRTETVLRCELNEEERTVYNSILAATQKDLLDKLEKGANVFAALEALLRLRQTCCHLSLIPGQKANQSSKIELLMETLERSIEQGHRALIFSQWTSFLDLIEPYLNEKNISFLRLDGTTRNRQDVIRNFQDGNQNAMLMSLKSGGVGITLTAADHVFLMDPWWNPAAEDQAADRAHRIGQKNPVLIHKMVAQDTVEDRILDLQKKKLQLAASVLQGSGKAVSLTRDDIIALLK